MRPLVIPADRPHGHGGRVIGRQITPEPALAFGDGHGGVVEIVQFPVGMDQRDVAIGTTTVG